MMMNLTSDLCYCGMDEPHICLAPDHSIPLNPEEDAAGDVLDFIAITIVYVGWVVAVSKIIGSLAHRLRTKKEQ